MKRPIAALLCALLLLGTCLPIRAGAAESVYFTAINDNLLNLTADTMPAWVEGVLYVPYTVFDSGSGASNLRINWNLNRDKNLFTLYTLNETLVFDLARDSSKNAHTGESYYYKAITRNGRVYLPIAFVCQFFDLSLSRISTPYGELVRIKNSAVVLEDWEFADAAASLMETRLKRYNQSIAPADPEPSETVTPTSPVEPPPGGDDTHGGTRVYLAFRCTPESGKLDRILDVLDGYRYTALILVSPDDVDELAPLLRRAVARGHSVGLLLSGSEPTALLEQMNRGNQALERIACVGTALFAMESGSGNALNEQGYVEYRFNVDGDASASRVMARVSSRSTARILFGTGDTTASSLSQVLTQLRRETYNIRPAVEPEF